MSWLQSTLLYRDFPLSVIETFNAYPYTLFISAYFFNCSTGFTVLIILGPPGAHFVCSFSGQSRFSFSSPAVCSSFDFPSVHSLSLPWISCFSKFLFCVDRLPNSIWLGGFSIPHEDPRLKLRCKYPFIRIIVQAEYLATKFPQIIKVRYFSMS